MAKSHADFDATMRMLIDVLQAKARTLTQVLTITENQENMLLSDEMGEEMASLWRGINQEKQTLIREVQQADTTFQNLFALFGDDFEVYAEAHKEELSALQEWVRRVMDLDVKIRVQEKRNRTLTGKPHKGTKKEVTEASRRYITRQYAQNKDKK